MADKNQILTDEQIGLGATKPAAPKTLSDSDIGFDPPARGFKGWAQDVAATAVKGAIGVPEMLVGLADIPTGGRVGKFLENEGGAVGFRPKQAKEMVNDWHSDATKEAQRKFQQADGFVDKAVTAIQNPSNIFVSVGESIPSMLAGGLAGRGIMATTKLGTMGTKGAALAGAAGEGLTMAGSAAEQIRQETEDGLLTPGQAAAAGLTGVVGAGLGALGGRVANKLGIGDVDTMIAQGAKGVNADVAAGAARAAANPLVQQSALRAIPTKVVQGAISEGFLEELPQSVAEQVFQNLALGKDWHEDVDAAAVMGVLSGSAMGGAASGFRAFKESGAQSQEPGAQGVAGTDPAQPQAPSTGLQRVQSAFEAQLRALQEQEQGEPEVPQTAPPSGAELTAKQRAAALANRAADIDRDRSTMGPDDEIFQSTGMAAPLTPSQQMGLRSGPEAGTMEAAAALAVDTGAAGQMQQAAQAAQTAQQQQKGKGKQAAQAVDTETGEIVGAEGDFTTWSDQDLSNTFRSAQSRDVRLKLAKELARRREERDQAELRAELEAEQTALDLPNVDDGAFARMTEDAGDVPAELSQPLITNEGAQLVTQAPQAQQSQTAGQEAPNQGRTGAAVTAAQGGGLPAAGTTGVEANGLTQSARPAVAPEGPSQVDALRTQLQEVEAKIMRAAPDAMGAGGGDIEAAMKSRKVPVPLKAQRKKLQEQIRKAQGTDTQQFAPETGTLGIPRSEMPQVPSTSHGGLVKHLNAQGIAHETTTVDAASLKPTQAEFSPAKVEAAKAATGDRAVIVSNDGHIIDGHHQAVAAAQDGKPVKAIVLDAPVEQALAAVKASPSAQAVPAEPAAAQATKGTAPAESYNQDRVVAQLAEAIRSGGWEAFTSLRTKIANTYRLSVRQTLDLNDLTRSAVGVAEFNLEYAKADPFKAGRVAFANNEAPIVPEGLNATQSAKWMEGYDAGNAHRDSQEPAKKETKGEMVGEAVEVVEAPKLAAPKKPARGVLAKMKAQAREMNEDGRAKDGKPVTVPAADQSLFVTFGGKTYPVASIEDAQRKWVTFQESAAAGVSEVGNGLEVTDQDGKMVARVSFNGRAWSPDNKLLAEAPTSQAAKEQTRGPVGKVAAVTATTEAAPATAGPQPEASDDAQVVAQQDQTENEIGPFGPILTQYRGDAQGAIKALTELQDGEAVAALNHPDVGDIDLVWGEVGTSNSDGLGLAKLVKWHPEVLGDLQGFLNGLRKDTATSGKNRVRLVGDDGKAVVRLQWDGQAKTWLLTAYESAPKGSTRTDTGAADVKDDTASLNPERGASVPAQEEGYKPAGESFYTGGKLTQEDGRDLKKNWPEGQQRTEQAVNSPHPLTSAKEANPAADFPDARPVNSSVSQANAETQDTEQPAKLTADQATSQIRWQDMGTKDGVHTHSLFFYETQEAFESNQGRMAYGTITKGDVSASKWSVDGVEGAFDGLADAKKAAVAHALERLIRDGYVQAQPKAATPGERFEQLRAKGGQNSGINAFTKIAGTTGEAGADVWQRWRSVMGFDDKVNKGAGADVAKAMQEQLLKAPWGNDAVYPGDGRSMSPVATLHQWRVREGKFAEQKESFSRDLDREELRARDAENFGVPAEAVNQAREAVAAMRKRVIELEAEIKEGVAQAEAREEAAKSAEQKAYQDSFELPSLSVLAKKPTPASISNWSDGIELRGQTVYTNGHLLDTTGTPPHLKDWNTRVSIRNVSPSATDRVLGMAGVRDGIPDGSHVKAEPLALIDSKKNGRVFFDVEGKVVALDLNYARYFASKVKGATFTANPRDLNGPMRIMDGEKLAGIVMPIRLGDSAPTVADIRGYMAASGKDKPQSVVKRVQQTKDQEKVEAAQPEPEPAEAPADDFPVLEAASSYAGISHSGSQRAKADAAEFEAYIERAKAEGMKLAETDEQKAAVEKATKDLRAEYLEAYRRLMGVRAGTYSGFVAGRSGLNARQADKRNSAYDRAIDGFVAWQKDNEGRVRRAALDARTPEAKQADADAVRIAGEQKAEAKENADLNLMRKILNWKKGGDPVAIGKAAILNGVNLDKAGYPSSVKLAPTDGSTLTDDKFDLAALFRRKGMSVPESKRRVRELVDAVRAEDGAASAPAAPASEAPKAAESKTPTVDRHMETMKAVREGKATLEQFKASFNAVVDGKEAILAELDTKTKVELLRAGGAFMQMRYASEKKFEVVEAFYRQLIGEYTLGSSVSYGMGRGAYEAAVRKMVESTDEDKLQRYVEERKAAVAEAQARRAAREQALTDPKTLADFKEVVGAKIRDGMSAQEAFLSLTPEQRIKYDTLAAESTRDRREELKRKAKTQVATAGNTSASEVIATKHTKLGHDLFVVKLADRVERDEYLTLNASAKRLGGSYSSFRGNGAIPGFQFRTREAAEAFRALVEGDTTQAQELAAQRRDAFEDDRSQTAVERLRAMADKLEAQAAEEEGRERKSNTARRARFASAALAGAAADKAKAKTMRNIAAAIEAGNAKFLDEVRTKSQVDMLTNLVATAKYNELRARYPSYADQEKRRGEPPTAETADFAEFPTYTSFRSDLASLAREMLEVEGTKKLGQRLMSVADDVTDAYLEFAKANLHQVSQFGRGDAMADFSNREDAERSIRRSGLTGKAIVLAVKRGQNRVILSPSEAIGRQIWSGDGDKRITLNGEFGAELVEAIGRRGNKQNRLTVPWQFQNTYDRRKALSRLGIETASEYRSALREFIALKEQALVNRTREMELQMVGRKADGLDFFPTSAAVADQMIEAADLSPDMAVLEPSAGMGHLADRIREAGAEPDVIEISGDRRELLEEKGYHLAPYNDFLQMEPRKFFTYGDVFRAPDGTEGTMRGVGRMGSQRVRLEDENGNRLGLYDRDELTGIGHRGSWSGYDRIIMNPPFSNRRDAEHVMHAYTLLRPGGRVVAIMGEGVFFGQDKKAQEFRDWLESVNGTSEKLPEGSFMDPSLPVNTAVNARMVVIDKPAGDLALPDRDGAGAGAKFSQGLLSPAGNGKKPSRETVQAIVNSFQRAAKETLPITVVNQPSEVNGLVAPSGTKPSGAVFDGRIYLFADNLVSPGDVHVTIFHELFHLGLQRVIPAKDYAALLQQFANNPLVARYVRDWKASPEGQQRAESMTPQAYETLAREEALAMVSEDLFADAGIGSARQPALVKRMLSWLADVADKIGTFGNLGNWIRGLTQTDAEKFVTQMTRAILGGRQNLERTRAKFGTTKANFSKPTNLRQSGTEKELADLFKSLEAPRGLKLTQAYRAVDQHPLADKIREVESNFLDILERLDDAGLVQINC